MRYIYTIVVLVLFQQNSFAHPDDHSRCYNTTSAGFMDESTAVCDGNGLGGHWHTDNPDNWPLENGPYSDDPYHGDPSDNNGYPNAYCFNTEWERQQAVGNCMNGLGNTAVAGVGLGILFKTGVCSAASGGIGAVVCVIAGLGTVFYGAGAGSACSNIPDMC